MANKLDRIKAFMSSPWGAALKGLFSMALLAFFFLSVDVERLKALWREVTWVHLACLGAMTVVRNVLGALRNRVVVRVVQRVPLAELVRQQFLATFFNNFLPTSIGGDGARVYYLSRFGIPMGKGTMLLIIERLIGFYALVVIAGLSVFFWPAPEHLRWAVIAGALGYTAGLAALFFMPRLTFLTGGLIKGIRGVLDHFRGKVRLLLIICFWSFLYQLISIYISYYVAAAVIPDLSIVPFLTLVPLVWFFTMVPVSLGGVGLRELAFVQLLAVIGVGQEQALFISLGTYLALVMSGLVGGVLHLLGPGPGRRPDQVKLV